jgi:SAM-dependent methyltransferase
MESLPPAYFDRIYAGSDDPWGFETRPYERDKYNSTLDALPRERYESAFEIGCSIGVLSHKLAGRCDRLLSVDVSEKALARARERCRNEPHIRFEQMRVPQQFPDESFDLILVSEVGYYWSWKDLAQALHLIETHLRVGGHLLLVHWTPEVADYPLTGDDVHEFVLSHAEPGLHHMSGSREACYRLDLFERTDDSISR